MGAIVIENVSDAPVYAFVSIYSDSGDDSWFLLDRGQADTWTRTNWQVVGFKNESDTERAATYVRPGATVRFFSMSNIQVQY